MSSKNQENEISPIYSWPPSDSGKYLGGNGPSMSSSFQQVQFSQVGGTVALSQFPKGSSGTVLVGNGASDSSYKYWLPSLGLGTDTGSAAPSALLVNGNKQTVPTVKGVHIGMDTGTAAGIELTAASAAGSSYIDFNYALSTDSIGRLIYNFSTDVFEMFSLGNIRLTANGYSALNINNQGAFGVGPTPGYGTNGQVLTSQGISASPQWQSYSALLTRPVQTIYDGPAINSVSPYQNTYSYTLPAGYLYAVIDMQAGGGKGGNVQNLLTPGATLYQWAGGGASGGRVTVRIKAFNYPAGTVVDISVGSGASNNNGRAGGYDTYVAIGANYTLAKGGGNGTSIISTGGGVGSGGACSTNIFTGGLTQDILLDHWGQNGKFAFSADTVNFLPAGFSGEGGASLQGQPGPMNAVFGANVRNGTDANGRGAGGEGALGVNIDGGNSKYGGAGSPGWASITVFYQ